MNWIWFIYLDYKSYSSRIRNWFKPIQVLFFLGYLWNWNRSSFYQKNEQHNSESHSHNPAALNSLNPAPIHTPLLHQSRCCSSHQWRCRRSPQPGYRKGRTSTAMVKALLRPIEPLPWPICVLPPRRCAASHPSATSAWLRPDPCLCATVQLHGRPGDAKDVWRISRRGGEDGGGEVEASSLPRVGDREEAWRVEEGVLGLWRRWILEFDWRDERIGARCRL